MTAWAVHFNSPVPYAKGLAIQNRLLRARQENRIPDTVLLLQHPPTVTVGNRGRTNFLLKSPEEYAAAGIELHRAERGGDVTYHAPGQWVLYPILRLGGEGADSHGYLYNLEETAIRTAAAFGVDAWRREGKNGAWTEQGKIAAIGFRLKRWVSFHGMSFNVRIDLSGFATIVPCGLVGLPVASLETLLGAQCPAMPEAGTALLKHFSAVCGRPLERFEADGDLPALLQALIRGA